VSQSSHQVLVERSSPVHLVGRLYRSFLPELFGPEGAVHGTVPVAGGKDLACPLGGQALPELLPELFGPEGTIHGTVPVPLAPLSIPAGPRPAGPPVDPVGPRVSPAYVSGAALVASSRPALSASSTMGHSRSHFERTLLLGQMAGPQGQPSMTSIVASPPGLPPVTPGLPGITVLNPYSGVLYQARPSDPIFGSQMADTLGQVILSSRVPYHQTVARTADNLRSDLQLQTNQKALLRLQPPASNRGTAKRSTGQQGARNPTPKRVRFESPGSFQGATRGWNPTRGNQHPKKSSRGRGRGKPK